MGEQCDACGHYHTGWQWDYICVRCPCPETPGRPTEDDEDES